MPVGRDHLPLLWRHKLDNIARSLHRLQLAVPPIVPNPRVARDEGVSQDAFDQRLHDRGRDAELRVPSIPRAQRQPVVHLAQSERRLVQLDVNGWGLWTKTIDRSC